MRRTGVMILVTLIAVALCAPVAHAKKKKKKEEAPKIEPGTWYDYHGTQCYNPPDFASEQNEPKRRMLRQNAMDEMMKLLKGEINEQIVVEERKIDAWETDFLGKPKAIEPFVAENLTECKKFADGELGLGAYVKWLAGGGKRATAGDCVNPLQYELHQNLTVQEGWQVRRHMCKDDQVLIETTRDNKYTVADTGDYDTTPWITPEGDPTQPEAGPDYPCPQCPVGAVVYRFEFDDDSKETLLGTLGPELEFKAPGHGYISFTVNDQTYYDNRFHEDKGVIDYLPLSIYPPILGIDDGAPPDE